MNFDEVGVDRRSPVDVIIACHSSDRPLSRAVSSVLEGSTGLASVTVVAHNIAAEKLKERLNPKHREMVNFLELEDGLSSPAGPFQLGINRSDAPWVSIMGSDDFLEPGAVRAWLSNADGMDAVISRVQYEGGRPMRTPPVRPLRRGQRLPVKDRLFYRSAPLGIMRKQTIEHLGLELTPDVPTGEDLAWSIRLWSQGKISVQRRGPGYIVGENAKDRVTMRRTSISQQFKHFDHVWNPEFLGQLSEEEVEALGTKYLRIHIFGAATYRSEWKCWTAEDRENLKRKIETILTHAPGSERPLSIADRSLLDSLINLNAPTAEIDRLTAARRKFGRIGTLIPRDARYLFHREAPIRFSAASAMVR